MNPILYVEHEADDIYFLQRAFKGAGINCVLPMAGSVSAVEYLSGTGKYSDRLNHPPPCLVILDLNLPGKSGIELLRWIRNEHTDQSLPVIILTSSKKYSDMQQAYEEGANGFLIKPDSPAGLMRMSRAIRDYWLVNNRHTQTLFT